MSKDRVDEDEKFGDQAYNAQADISMLLDGHFKQLNEKFDGMLMRHTDNFNRWITTDLHHLDAECKAAKMEQADRLQAAKTLNQVSRLKWFGGLGGGGARTSSSRVERDQ